MAGTITISAQASSPEQRRVKDGSTMDSVDALQLERPRQVRSLASFAVKHMSSHAISFVQESTSEDAKFRDDALHDCKLEQIIVTGAFVSVWTK